MKKLFCKKNFFLLATLFVFSLFAYMTYKTPLAGDDWGYALNGSLGTPIKTALELYQSWSGRFFSELWGMIIPNNKWLWNIINPLLFTGIYVCIYKLCGVSKKPILCALFILQMMLSVDDNLRMETYTWIMGTTYVIPLFFSLFYFSIVERLFIEESLSKKTIVLNYTSNIALFIIGLMMENIAATMIGSIIILIIYAYFKKKQIIKYLLLNLIFSVVSFVIMRLSPGSASRLVSEHGVWANMNLFEKLASGYPNFLEMTFINNNYAIALYSIVLIAMIIFSKKKISLLYKLVSIIILVLGIISVFSFVIGETMLNNSSSLFSMIFWPVYIINSFASIYLYSNDEYQRDKTILFLIVAGASALVMLFSPIYGSRSALYTVYYLIAVSLLILDKIEIKHKYIVALFGVILLAIVGDRTNELVYKYRLIGLREKERLEVIKYYQDHPEVEEAWIPRFPIYTIHGADIEEGDTYHFETFKEYYGLPQDADKIVFYYVEDD